MRTHKQRGWTSGIWILMALMILASIALHIALRPAALTTVLMSPFIDPTAKKVMLTCGTLIAFVGGMGVKFVPEMRASVLHACGALLVCTFALGLTITLL